MDTFLRELTFRVTSVLNITPERTSRPFPPCDYSACAQAAARCKLAIESLETSSESSFGSSSSTSAKSKDKDEPHQRLVERYYVLKDSMMDWGVEVS